MLIDKTKRCRHCGGTLWQDDNILKCVTCSRPLEGQNDADQVFKNLGNPRLAGEPHKLYKHSK